ncbi:Transposase DDE domain-containing protein [Anaerovirgula multivorans]|uniref:Transposase DDE domain-containing protein n=1 Tax=Anaerovirgula multivorans TaxID=312168 RepID=A0A239IMH7_9FIRM|nr:transposase [Anaerovirgula multivorans]SNS94592.1 Transposase DDE domain-containing protein [Anaerovirgula multivorans]
MERVKTKAFQEASNNRFKVERRFATMVRNHGLRRCRYVKISRAKEHIIIANMICNIGRMVNLLCSPKVLCVKFKEDVEVMVNVIKKDEERCYSWLN